MMRERSFIAARAISICAARRPLRFFPSRSGGPEIDGRSCEPAPDAARWARSVTVPHARPRFASPLVAHRCAKQDFGDAPARARAGVARQLIEREEARGGDLAVGRRRRALAE